MVATGQPGLGVNIRARRRQFHEIDIQITAFVRVSSIRNRQSAIVNCEELSS
jgi:hypothetical protein